MPYREPPPKRTKVLRFCLDVLAKPTPCRESWALMDGGDCHRTCTRCGETVTDVTEMEPTEAEAFLEERIDRAPFLDVYVRDDGRVMTKPCVPGLRRQRAIRIATLIAAVAGLGVLIAAR
jgi:hypothetical protein